ncbi:MAG: helix-turn-helix domain-containing protein [Halioglobus sp.]
MSNNFIVLNQTYEYFEQLRDEAIAWDLDFRQTGAGRSGHRLVQLAGANFGLVYTAFRAPYDQRSVAPRGLRTFSILADNRAPSTWCGYEFTANTLVAMPITEEFSALSTGYFSNYVFSLPEELLAESAREQHHRDWDDLRPDRGGAALTISSDDICDLRALLRRLTETACFSSEHIALDRISTELASLIVRALMSVSQVTAKRKISNRRDVFQNARQFIDNNIQSGVSIEGICKQINVSQRTLQYAFKEQFHISPKVYLNCQRLARVREELLVSDRVRATVTEVAGRWGFWHMGQFARDYRKIYGENPNSTLAREYWPKGH